MSQAVDARFVGVGRTGLCCRQVVERMKLARAFLLDFQEKQARYAKEILRRFAYFLAFGNSLRDAVDGFVRVIFREWTAEPLKEPD